MFFEQYAHTHTHTRSECNARARSFSLSQSRSFIYMRKRELCNWNTTQLYILRGIRTNRMWRTEDGLFFHSRCQGRAGRQGGQSLHSAHTHSDPKHTCIAFDLIDCTGKTKQDCLFNYRTMAQRVQSTTTTAINTRVRKYIEYMHIYTCVPWRMPYMDATTTQHQTSAIVFLINWIS